MCAGQQVNRHGSGRASARALQFPFNLSARTESFLRGSLDLDDVIKRLQAFEKVGADVLMVPGCPISPQRARGVFAGRTVGRFIAVR